MATLLMAMQIAKKLNGSQIRVLEYFVKHKRFEGSYRELSSEIYGKNTLASNTRRFVNELAEMGILAVAVNDECYCFDSNRTLIHINENWLEAINED
jgi:hypothetical protein